MISTDEAEARVARGAVYLDGVRPGWHDEIDVGTLRLHDPCGCIVGQLMGTGFSSFLLGVRRLGISNDEEQTRQFGLNLNEPGWLNFTEAGGTVKQWYQPLQDAWIAAIAARRFPVPTFEESKPAPAVREDVAPPLVPLREKTSSSSSKD